MGEEQSPMVDPVDVDVAQDAEGDLPSADAPGEDRTDASADPGVDRPVEDEPVEVPGQEDDREHVPEDDVYTDTEDTSAYADAFMGDGYAGYPQYLDYSAYSYPPPAPAFETPSGPSPTFQELVGLLADPGFARRSAPTDLVRFRGQLVSAAELRRRGLL